MRSFIFILSCTSFPSDTSFPQPVEKKKLQLIGCVSMMLACKYEEIMPPEVRDFVHISANTYTRVEMLAVCFLFSSLIVICYYVTLLWPLLH